MRYSPELQWKEELKHVKTRWSIQSKEQRLVYCPIVPDLYYLLCIFFLMGIIIDASMDLSIPTNIRETPAPNKIPANK